MIGFYNYTVIITYLSLVSAGLGMYFSTNGNFKGALVCLLVSGFCDMLDGPVARTKKRTDSEKKFGIQIDSLCDCVGFCIQPAVFTVSVAVYADSENCALTITAIAVGMIFALCGVIRLAYFNVTEEERQQKEGSKLRTGYQGLPVTNASLIIPLFYLSRFFITGVPLAIVMIVVLAIIAFLFVYNFHMVKLHGKWLIPIGLLGTSLCVGVCFLPTGL